MIDIHSHILPNVDDGSRSLEMSLEMVSAAYDSGVRSMIVTPHCYPGVYDNYAGEKLQAAWDELHEAVRARGIPVHLYQGLEILATEDLPQMLEEGSVWTLNGTKYFLVEFPFDEDPAFCRDILSVCIKEGYTPIVAHPERYYFVQDDRSLVYEWYTMGCGIQVNKDSLLNRYSSSAYETGCSLLRHNLVTCVASDAHRPYMRTTDLDEVREFLIREYGEEYAYMLLEENPDRILRGKPLVGYRPHRYSR